MSVAETAALDEALVRAHRAGNFERLSDLYERAADHEERRGRIDAACFFLTQAWVFALEARPADVERLEARLRRHGRV